MRYQTVADIRQFFIDELNDEETSGAIYSHKVAKDEDNDVFIPVITIRLHGLDTDYAFGYDFFSSSEYLNLYQQKS